MGPQPGKLLCYLAAISEECDLLQDPLILKINFESRISEAGKEILPMSGNDGGSAFLDFSG